MVEIKEFRLLYLESVSSLVVEVRTSHQYAVGPKAPGKNCQRVKKDKSTNREMGDDYLLILLSIRYQNETYQLDIEEKSTISQLKLKLEDLLKVPKDVQRLLFQGRILKDTEMVDSFSKHIKYYIFSVPKFACSIYR